MKDVWFTISHLVSWCSGEGESEGKFTFGGYLDEVKDLETVVAFLRNRNWRPWILIGHSRGSNVSILYTLKHPAVFRGVVTLSARYDISKGFSKRHEKDLISMKQQGWFEFKLRWRGQMRDFRTTTAEWAILLTIDDHLQKKCMFSFL